MCANLNRPAWQLGLCRSRATKTKEINETTQSTETNETGRTLPDQIKPSLDTHETDTSAPTLTIGHPHLFVTPSCLNRASGPAISHLHGLLLGMDAMGHHVDAIDLTLTSSPEPEPRPSQQRRSQPQVQHHVEKESRSYSMASKHSRVAHPASAGRATFPQHQTPAVNPHHLRQIVYTSDEHALRKVLLHLCQISPALSGAVARGLAPHSTFARQVVNRRRNTTAAPSKFEHDSNDSAYERTKKRLASTSTSLKRSSRLPDAPNKNADAPVGRESHAATSKHSMPRVKSESRPISGQSGTDSDDIHLPGAYPGMNQVASIASPVLSTPKTSINANRTPITSLASARPSNTKRELPKKELCVKCRLSFTADSAEVCMYHTGPKVRRDGQVVYRCCDAPLNDAGCQFGCHTSAEETQQDANDRKRPSASPHPPGAERKRARKL